MRRILFCPPLYPPTVGGSQTLFADLAGLWNASGSPSVVYTTQPPAEVAMHDGSSRPDGAVKIRRFPLVASGYPRLRGKVLGALSTVGPVKWRAATGFPHLLTRGYRSFLKNGAPQEDGPFQLVVGGVLPHMHFLEPACRFALGNGIPLLLIPLLHAGLLETRSPVQVFGPGAGEILRRADCVVALTEAEIPALLSLGVPRQKLQVVSPALETADAPGDAHAFARRHRFQEPYFLHAGALSTDKGTPVVLAAFRHLIQAGVPARLVLMGHPNTSMRHLLNTLPATARRRVSLLDQPSRCEWHDAMAGAVALVHPSRADSFGLVVLEAWRAGRPVVVAASGGPAHLVRPTEDGLVVPPGNPEALAAAMERLLADTSLAGNLGQTGRGRLQRDYVWDRVFPHWQQLFQETMGR